MMINDLLKAAYMCCFGFVLATTLGCDDDEVSPMFSIDDFTGSWTATSLVHTNNSDAEQVFDMIENGGEVRFTVLGEGRTRTWVSIGTYSDEWDAKVTMSGNTLTSVPVESSRATNVMTFEFIDESHLILTNREDTFNFGVPGEGDVSTTSVGEFERN